MLFSPELLELRNGQNEYEPNDFTLKHIHDKTLTTITSARRVGGTNVKKEIMRIEPTWSDVKKISTKTDLSLEVMYHKIQKRELVNYCVTKAGHIHGTLPEDYTADYTILETPFRNIEGLQNAGLKRVVSTYLATEPDEWAHQRVQAEMSPHDLAAELDLDIDSLEIAIANAGESWLHLVNYSHSLMGGLQSAAHEVVNITMRQNVKDSTEQRVAQAKLMLERAKELAQETRR